MPKRHAAVIVGTRPEAIKMAPVVLELRRRPDDFHTSVVATAQHREMLDQVLEIFSITPDVDLDLMTANQSLATLTARLLTALDKLWRRTPPDVVLVQGDTTSCFVGGLAAYYLKIPVGHVEAGLRTGNKYAPFPEEMNRHFADVMADYCFAPTDGARDNLLREGVPADRVFVTGNTGIDALLITLERLERNGFMPPFAREILSAEKRILVTAHRRESFGQPFLDICSALRAVAQASPETAIVYPVHPNPQVSGPVREQLGGLANVHLIDPLDYPSFVYLMSRANVILTDSGGVQEEAPSLGAPVLVMRETTERPEAVEAGLAEVVGTSVDRIVTRTTALLRQPRATRREGNPFGDGHASRRIADILAREK